MLNYQSVRSSEPQVRSNPALRQLGTKSGFQKRLCTLLEPTPLPFPTFQIVKEASQQTLQSQQLYAWIRPSHLRSQWLVLADGFPALLHDPKHEDRISSLRISFDKKQVQLVGPIVCEAAWDAQDHILWIFDIVVWEKQMIWNKMAYSNRWELIKKVFGTVLDHGHPMSDAELRIPNWISLSDLAALPSIDPAMSIEFQPEKAGQRRQLLLLRDEGIQFKPMNHHERKMVAEQKPHIKKVYPVKQQPKQCAIVLDEEHSLPKEIYTPAKEEPVQEGVKQPVHPTTCKLYKDKTSRTPDTYRLESTTGEALGLAAIRSLELSKQLRESLAVHESIVVGVVWYEPFQKYEVKRILESA
jgi:hypothetical protein